MIRLLAISGSLRARSSNTEVLRAAARLAPASTEVRLFDGLALLPAFNPDDDVPDRPLADGVRRLRDEVARADALLISTPEYAHGVPGALKNALDWLVSGPEIVHKPILLINTSPRSTHAQASLAETLRTMSTTLVTDEPVVVPLSGRPLGAEQIAADAALAQLLRAALDTLTAAVPRYRDWRAQFA